MIVEDKKEQDKFRDYHTNCTFILHLFAKSKILTGVHIPKKKVEMDYMSIGVYTHNIYEPYDVFHCWMSDLH